MKVFQGIFLGIIVVSSAANAEPLLDKPEWQFANLLYEGGFTCESKSKTYQAAIRLRSAQELTLRDNYMACIKEFSEKARSEFPIAMKKARSDAVKSDLKELYASWNAYFGDFSGPDSAILKSKYASARAALEVELSSSE